ncbi:MAG: ribosome maturation factor RimP, partial [Rickettsiales bacterium]|nr:ribosome maturation factor RimP [Rickettsiales bacterium]
EAAYSGRVLRILLERLDGSTPTIGECEKASKAFSANLDVEDLIQEKYLLEVGSAGIERPLAKPADYARFAGREAKVELKEPILLPSGAIDGGIRKKRLVGKIVSAKGETICMETEADGLKNLITFEFGDVQKAKLRFSDDSFKKILNDNKKERKTK